MSIWTVAALRKEGFVVGPQLCLGRWFCSNLYSSSEGQTLPARTEPGWTAEQCSLGDAGQK